MIDVAGYPAALEHRVTVAGDVAVRMRPIRPDDEPRLQALFQRLSPESTYQRFFSAMRSLPSSWAHYLANVDYHRRLALVAERDGMLVGVARYDVVDADATTVDGHGPSRLTTVDGHGPSRFTSAEIALVVEDAWQGRGLGAQLLTELLAAGEERGIREFRADVLGGNRRMLRLLHDRTTVIARTSSQGVVELRFVMRRPALPAPS